MSWPSSTSPSGSVYRIRHGSQRCCATTRIVAALPRAVRIDGQHVPLFDDEPGRRRRRSAGRVRAKLRIRGRRACSARKSNHSAGKLIQLDGDVGFAAGECAVAHFVPSRRGSSARSPAGEGLAGRAGSQDASTTRPTTVPGFSECEVVGRISLHRYGSPNCLTPGRNRGVLLQRARVRGSIPESRWALYLRVCDCCT